MRWLSLSLSLFLSVLFFYLFVTLFFLLLPPPFSQFSVPLVFCSNCRSRASSPASAFLFFSDNVRAERDAWRATFARCRHWKDIGNTLPRGRRLAIASRSWLPSRCVRLNRCFDTLGSDPVVVRIQPAYTRHILRNHITHTHTHTHTYTPIHTHTYENTYLHMQQLLLVLGCSMFLSAVPYSVAVSPALDCLLYVSCFHREHSLSRGVLSTSSIFARNTRGRNVLFLDSSYVRVVMFRW